MAKKTVAVKTVEKVVEQPKELTPHDKQISQLNKAREILKQRRAEAKAKGEKYLGARKKKKLEQLEKLKNMASTQTEPVAVQ